MPITRTHGYILKTNWWALGIIYIIYVVAVFFIRGHTQEAYPQNFEHFVHLTPQEYIYQEAVKAGLDPVKLLLIVNCESRFNRYAINVNKNGTTDSSYWQINSIHKVPKECMYNLICSTKWSIEKIKKDKGYKAWVCEKYI
jgi:hypothetical protein